MVQNSHPINPLLNQVNLANFTLIIVSKTENETPEQYVNRKQKIYNFALQNLDTFLAGGSFDSREFCKELTKGKKTYYYVTGWTPSTPSAVRGLIMSQLNDRSLQETGAHNGQNIRSGSLFHGTVGYVLTLSARIFRVAVRTILAPWSIAIALYNQKCYNVQYNLAGEEVKRIGREWLDLAITLFAVPIIALINTISPQAVPLDKLRGYYFERIIDETMKDVELDLARAAYNIQKEQEHANWKNATKDGK